MVGTDHETEKTVTKMTIGAAVFVKTPGYSPLKTRLAADLGTDRAEEFHLRATDCVRDVLQAACDLLRPDEIELVPCWAVAEPEAMTAECWRDFPCIGQGMGGLGERLDHVYRELVFQHDGAIVLGADSPQLTPDDLGQAARMLQSEGIDFCLGPSADGGFYLFGGTRPLSREIWTSIRYSQETTGDDLLSRVAEVGRCERLAEHVDVDTMKELRILVDSLDREGKLDSQRALAKWILSIVE